MMLMMEKHLKQAVSKNDPNLALLNNALMATNGAFDARNNEDEGADGQSEQIEDEEDEELDEEEEMMAGEENYEMDEYEDEHDGSKVSHSLLKHAQGRMSETDMALAGMASGKGATVSSSVGAGTSVKIEQNEKMIKKNKVIELYSKGERCVRKLSQLTGRFSVFSTSFFLNINLIVNVFVKVSR